MQPINGTNETDKCNVLFTMTISLSNKTVIEKLHLLKEYTEKHKSILSRKNYYHYYNYIRFSSLVSGSTLVSRYQKGKTSLDLNNLGKRWWGFGMQWHQLDHMQTIRTSLQTQITTPTPRHSISYTRDALPDAQPTVSTHWRQSVI